MTITEGQSKKLYVTGTGKKIKWNTFDSSVAKVSKNGKVTGVSSGKTKIFAVVNKKRYVCAVTVKEVDLTTTNNTEENNSSVANPVDTDDKTTDGVTEKGQQDTNDKLEEKLSERTDSSTDGINDTTNSNNVLVNEDNTSKDNYDKYLSDLEEVKEFISNQPGSKIEHFQDNLYCSIAIDYDDSLIFSMESIGDSSVSITGLTTTVDMSGNGLFTLGITDGDTYLYSYADLPLELYDTKNDMYFYIYDGNGKNYTYNDLLQSSSNKMLRISMQAWNLLLYQETGYRLSDIGFKRYISDI